MQPPPCPRPRAPRRPQPCAMSPARAAPDNACRSRRPGPRAGPGPNPTASRSTRPATSSVPPVGGDSATGSTSATPASPGRLARHAPVRRMAEPDVTRFQPLGRRRLRLPISRGHGSQGGAPRPPRRPPAAPTRPVGCGRLPADAGAARARWRTPPSPGYASFTASINSPAVRWRWSGSFDSARTMASSSCCGMPGRSEPGPFGWALRCACRVARSCSEANGACPVSASNVIAPSE